MEPYTLRDRANYLISCGVPFNKIIFTSETQKTLGLIKKLKKREKKYGYKFILCSICNKGVSPAFYTNHLLLKECVNNRDNEIWLNEISESCDHKTDPQTELDREKDEMKTCLACNENEEMSFEEFLNHLNSNRHKLYVKIEQNELKCLKAKMENWLETGIFHKV